MNLNEITPFLINPDCLDRRTLVKLQQLVELYPYVEVVRMLYLKNLKQVQDVRYGDALKKSALFIHNRSLLFDMIVNDTIPFAHVASSMPDESVNNRCIDLIDSYISTSNGEEVRHFDPFEAIALQEKAMQEKAQITSQETHFDEPPMKHQELIDNFLEMSEQKPIKISLKEDKEKEQVEQPVVKETPGVSEHYFSESLAKIYIKQGRYLRALEIIQRLNLKYPEKSIYFASQIDELENLIANEIKK